METSLNISNDAIFSKAKWLITSALAWSIMIQFLAIFNSLDLVYWLFGDSFVVEIFFNVGIYFILMLMGLLTIKEHPSTILRSFANLMIVGLIIASFASILLSITETYGRCYWFYSYDDKTEILRTLYYICGMTTIVSAVVQGYIICVALCKLSKIIDINISRTTHTINPYFIVYLYFAVVIFMGIQDTSECLSNMYPIEYIFDIISMLLKIFFIPFCWYVYAKLQMSSIESIEQQNYSYSPTKIEIGFIVCIALFIGLIYLVTLFV